MATPGLSGISFNQLTCLFRHWTWADDAMARFERELANGWEYEDDPHGDHLFGTYYHWLRCCAASVRRRSTTGC
jgi:hypothetical protein